MIRCMHRFTRLVALGVLALTAAGAARTQADDPLSAWNDGAAKAQIIAFVRKVTRPDGEDFVPPEERIAVFDNDGTLWSEQPMYFQLAFAIDRAKEMASTNSGLMQKPVLKAAVAGDMHALSATGERGLMELVALTHAGNTGEEFAQIVRDWTATARHPRFERPYIQLTFVPMREVLDYLRANDFRTWIVSGGGVEFLRVVSEDLYGVPPEQVIGSSVRAKYEIHEGKPVIVRLPEIDFIDDKAGKPVGIHKFIGRRPIAAFGNSDGDFEMLEWTTSAPGARLGLIVHHDDAEREYAYDRRSAFGKLDRGLDEAGQRGWIIVDMKTAWKTVYDAPTGR